MHRGMFSPSYEAMGPSGPQILDQAAWHQEAEERFLRRSGHTSVLFMDLDEFKAVNDEIGHDVGDQVIADFGVIVWEATEDFAGRGMVAKSEESITRDFSLEDPCFESTTGHIGGDEYAVLAETDLRGAYAIAERIRERLQTYLDLPGNERIKATGLNVSIGVATRRADMSKAEVLREADEAMYQDKLNHIDLNVHQIAAINEARRLLEASGIRLRAIPKIIKLLKLAD